MEARKKVLFILHSLSVGGVEKAFLGIVNKFLKENWEIHLALLINSGGFFKLLPKDVHIHVIEEFSNIRPIIHEPLKIIILNSFKQFRIRTALKFTRFWICQKLSHSNLYIFKKIFKNIRTFDSETFELAIAFAGPYPFIDYYVANRVNAKEKWGWIHFDISKFPIDAPIIKDVYPKFSKINIVSETAKQIFDKKFPGLKTKTCFTPNIIDVNLIKAMSKEKIAISRNDQIVICTVGRISVEKGQYMALEALDIIVKEYKSIVWWFVGEGNDLNRCRNFVKNNGLSKNVVFTGATVNPYPYMKACDIYVQPSMHEGFCITLAEAKIFQHPIIATDFTGAEEQLFNYPFKSKVIKYNSIYLAEAIKSMLKTF